MINPICLREKKFKKNELRSLFIVLALFAAFIRPAQGTTIFPVATNGAVSQAGIGLAFSGSNYLVGIQGDVVEYFDITAQLVSTNGSLIGSRIAIGRTGGSPSVAFGSTNFFVIWADDALYPTNVIYGQFINPSGTLVGSPFDISDPNTNADTGSFQSVAFGSGNYFVIWTDASGSNAPFSVAYGALVSPNGSLVVPTTLLSTDAYEPGIVFGKTNFLAIWQSRRPTGPELYDTYGQFISTNGVSGNSFIISQTPSPAYDPLCAAFDGTNFLVVWNKDIGPGYPSPAEWNFYGRLVSPNGTFPGSEIALVTDTNEPVYPFLIFDGANYLMAWHTGTTNSQIYYQFFNPSPAPAGPEFTLFSVQGTNAPLFGGVSQGNGQIAALGVIGAFGGGDFSSSTATYGAIIPSSTTSPTLTASNLIGTQFSLQLTGTPGINYAIQFNTNLALPNWTVFATNSPTNGTFSFTDTNATSKSRFYRAVKQ